ncbi:hypothetical protein N473_10080 [Pseudoalteromonas luteoviolacea CPMOR-1]|uniref:Uncharacterized protein n=1 Tax=Pseudoalteromonas luteoviolacea CPMOR-1 TaxID=1365248 RepID=A0A167M787_9GAMM|nr:hypothetical protein N473_10080 [Pseudoalteromonas luteoviolacea CPMOR-1]
MFVTLLIFMTFFIFLIIKDQLNTRGVTLI